ncbi:MFS transporter, partial [Amycolatopsis sp. M39]
AQAIVSTTLISYATTQFGLSRKSLLDTLNIALVVMIFAIPLFSWLSDKVGRRMVRVPAAALFAVFSFFMFPMLESRSTPIILLAFVISMAILNGAAAGTNGALLSELFPTKYRYTGTSVAYQMAGLIGGGIGPLLAAVFLAPGGPGPGAVAVMTAAFCVVSAVCTVFVGDTRKTDLQNA